MNEILILSPVFKEKLWGGTKLKELFDYNLTSENIGESWLISAHKNGRSQVVNGPFKGKYLDEVFENNRELFDNSQALVFPLLTKIIDAKFALSVQVHPNDEYAKKHAKDLGKTECWYILAAEENSKIILGHNAKSKDELTSLINNNQWDELLVYKDIKPGDFIYVPAGTIHAIGAGIVILETMQSSDTTYRVYDFDRKEKDGSLRGLHIKESIDVIMVPHQDVSIEPKVQKNGESKIKTFISNEFFTVEKWDINNTIKIANTQFKLFNVISGHGTINGLEINKGQGFIATSKCNEINIDGNLELIVSYL